MTKTKKPFKRIALSLSLIMMMLWIMLGTSTSVAWFSDTSNTLHNIFHIGDFSLVVSYQQENGTYKVIEQNTKVLNDEDLYEPGYVKVQYLKIENKGTQDFNFKTAVQVTGFKKSTNVFGEEFNLKDYLEKNGIDEVIFINNTMASATSMRCDEMRNLVDSSSGAGSDDNDESVDYDDANIEDYL